MALAHVSTVLDQPVDQVWAILGDFHRIDRWIPTVHHSRVVAGGTEQLPTIGSVREMTVGEDRHTTYERLVSYDARAHRMTYDLPCGPPFGMTDYLGIISARPVTDSGRTFVEWSGEYSCATSAEVPAVADRLSTMYVKFLGNLRDHLEELNQPVRQS